MVAKPRMVLTQFQNIEPNNVAQFRTAPSSRFSGRRNTRPARSSTLATPPEEITDHAEPSRPPRHAAAMFGECPRSFAKNDRIAQSESIHAEQFLLT
jgi:hypothetical protein